MKTLAVRIHHNGGPEVLDLETIEISEPGKGELLIDQTAIGLNFAEVYQRKGQAGPHAETAFPVILGSQGAGLIRAVGEGVTDFTVGEVVGYLHPGSYSVSRIVPAGRAVKLPPGVSAELAAAWLLRGMTAEYLLCRLYPVKAGETILVHAAAGGMGNLLSQWGHAIGARVIGTVGSDEKAKVALAHGCDAVINYATEDFVARVDQLTAGAGVSVVYDAVGKDVFVRSLDCLRPMGWAVNYGAASGPVGAFDIQLLHHKSLIVTRPTLRTYTATTEALRGSAAAFFDQINTGAITLDPPRRYPLTDVRKAHADLEGRRSTGASVLIP